MVNWRPCCKRCPLLYNVPGWKKPLQPNDQMHAAAPQAVLLEWTAAACKDDTTPANHIANLARYWIHALRFPEHAPTACTQLSSMLDVPHARVQTQEALQRLLAAEIQPLRLMRLCTLSLGLVDPLILAGHLERVLSGEIPSGKKLKLSQLALTSWRDWLEFRTHLSQNTFQVGLMLHVRAHLMTRQNVNPVHRVPKAWEMLTACVDYLPDVPEHSVYASMGLPKQLAVFMEHADVQTLYHAPWKDIQQLYSTENAAFMQLWAQLFSEHKPLLISILVDIEEQYHAVIRSWYLQLTDYTLEEDRCKPMLALVKAHPDWSCLLLQMLATKHAYQRLGAHLLGNFGCNAPAPQSLPGHFLRALTPGQWTHILNAAHSTKTETQLANAWALIEAHDLTVLQGCPALQKMTLQTLQSSTHRTKKVSPWDINFGAPEFYVHMVKRYVPESMHMAWFEDWVDHPTQEGMLVQVFQWFNPDVVVPPMKELLLLRQAMDTNNLVDILTQLSKNIETFDLPSMVE